MTVVCGPVVDIATHGAPVDEIEGRHREAPSDFKGLIGLRLKFEILWLPRRWAPENVDVNADDMGQGALVGKIADLK